MNRNRGTATVAVILAALVGMNYLPRGGRDTGSEPPKGVESSTTRANHHRVGTGAAAAPTPNEPCTEIGGLLARFYDGFDKVPYPKSCYKAEEHPAEQTTGNGPKLRVVIALLPNPVTTHFSLFFDRSVEAIQQAAQDEEYAYDASWFPWSDETRQYTRLTDDLASEERKHDIEAQPGVIVFRRAPESRGDTAHPYRDGLVVFVVGEQPTRGITDGEFENALKWFANLAPMGSDGANREPLRILGPTSSGALPSLHRELESNCDTWWGRPALEVFSGSVSSPSNFHWFSKAMFATDGAGRKMSSPEEVTLGNCHGSIPTPDIRTYNESDDLSTNRFCAYLSDQGYDLWKVAFLSEDETAFGSFVRGEISKADIDPETKKASTKPDACGLATQLYYPRDIAALQAAYEKQSVFATGKPAANAPSSTLRSDLSEPTGGEHDTVRAYGGQLDPLAQEAVLQAIVEQLREHQIQFVLVRSSNTLDQAFLSQFLRRSYPEGRVVLDAADLLFLRSRQDVSLRGVMILSTYPLLAEQKRWTPTLRTTQTDALHALHTFGQNTSESIYLAGRNLFGQDTEQDGEPIYDYLPPLWASQTGSAADPGVESRPATWLTVIGHRQFWPLAAIEGIPCEKHPPDKPVGKITLDCGVGTKATESSGNETTEDVSLLTPASATGTKVGSGPNQTEVVFPLQMKVLMVACAVLALWHLYCCWFASVTGPLRALTYFAPLLRIEHRLLIFVGSLAIGLLGIVLSIFGGMSVQWGLKPNLWLFTFLTTAAVLVFPMISLVGSYSLPRLRTHSKKHRDRAEGIYYQRWRGWPTRVAKWRKLVQTGVAALAILLIGYGAFLQLYLIGGLNDSNRFPMMWRSVHLLSGVSPLLPQVLMLLGLYGWFWCNLGGTALLGDDRPRLPKEADFPPQSMDPALREDERRPLLRLFSREEAQRPVERQALALGRHWVAAFVFCFALTAGVFRIALQGWGIRSLGEMRFGYVVFWWLVIVVAIVLADAVQLFRTWGQLHCLLLLLDRLPLRRTLAAMKGIAWGSVWKMGGNVLEERYRVLSRQLETLGHLRNEIEEWECQTLLETTTRKVILGQISNCQESRRELARWYVALSDQREQGLTFKEWRDKLPEAKRNVVRALLQWSLERFDYRLDSDVGPMKRFQEELARTAGMVIGQILEPQWRKDKQSLLIELSGVSAESGHDKEHGAKPAIGDEVSSLVRCAEEFSILQYLGFIQNMMGRIRSMVVGMLILFAGAALAVSTYPFDPLPVLGGLLLAVFAAVGTVVVWVFAGMFRDATLSYVTNTNPGELGWEFWGQLLTFGVGPLLALLTTLFPSLTDFLVSWIQPGTTAFK